MNILLMGNPNVGKSVIFSRLTGSSVTASNYAGTTVEYMMGKTSWQGREVKIIDLPGTYTLEPNNKAEEVAVEMLAKGDLVINVLDATNLERNLNLTLQLLEREIPVVVVLNLWDEAEKKGIKIDWPRLEEILGVPVIPTIAVRGKGLDELREKFGYREIVRKNYGKTSKRWSEIERITAEVQTSSGGGFSFTELVEDITIKPLTGIPILIIILYVSFLVVRFIGEGLITGVVGPFFLRVYLPLLEEMSQLAGSGGLVHDLIIGRLISGEIDLEQSFGLLSTGIYIPFSAVLPYIISFYFVLGLWEDTGYLPRIAVLVDNVMHGVGLHGFSVIPMILGLGCNVPAALAIRSLETRRERFITATLTAVSIPCMAQIAMIFGLLGQHGGIYILYIFIILGLVWIGVGLILNKVTSGERNELLLEIPSFRIPGPGAVCTKLWMRIKSFLREAVPLMLLGVIIINLLDHLGFFTELTSVLGRVVDRLFGLPPEVVSALLMGFVRKDLAMGLLVPLNLTVKQLMVASAVLAVYFPCMATFVVLARELGLIDMLKALLVMFITAISVGGFLNFAIQGGDITTGGWVVLILLMILISRLPDLKEGR